MITLITGQPGAGKTLYGLNYVRAWSERENRPVYYNGINDLKLPWSEIDSGEDWHKCPDGSIIVIDECQRVFRPRGNGTNVPEHVALLETHRHRGIDVVLITQHPMLVDTNVRRLCGRHFCVVRAFGTKKATVHEWAEVHEQCDKNRAGSIRHDFFYPKTAFAWYKSAEIHTHKARIPPRVFFLLLIPVLLGLVGWYMLDWYESRSKASSTNPLSLGLSKQVNQSNVITVGAKTKNGASEPMQWFYDRVPRVSTLPHTAPMYDNLTQPVEVPIPAACVSTGSRCQCWTQQATLLELDEKACRGIVKTGYFVSWKREKPAEKTPAVKAVSLPELEKPAMDLSGRGSISNPL